MNHTATRHQELGQIHGHKRRLELDDTTYRSMLFALTGKRSAAHLDEAERHQVIDFLSRQSKPTTAGRPARTAPLLQLENLYGCHQQV
jgi:phage gp16-like protein